MSRHKIYLKTMSHKRRSLLIVGTGLACLLCIMALVLISRSRFNPVPNIVATASLPATSNLFPVINTANLSTTQTSILKLLQQEYASQPAGTKYADGVEESWCADFVSWVMKESGNPLTNPNTGGWRIPGTYTLREYYESTGQFKAASTNYSPKLGDVVLYDNPSPHGQHTNIVIKNDNGIVTTVGGNEGGKIRVQTGKLSDDVGLVGYGVLE
ncbi:MAG: CHAP domain-containing protein [Candidatus Microsaccharimonas sp.]